MEPTYTLKTIFFALPLSSVVETSSRKQPTFFRVPAVLASDMNVARSVIRAAFTVGVL